MQNKTSGSRRPRWLNAYRVTITLLLVAAVVMGAITLSNSSSTLERSFLPINTGQATKVARTTSFLESAGFAQPVYLGITPGAEGEYPTFRATAIGGQPVNLWIRTTSNGGTEIQPVGVFKSVTSADDFARLAQMAVYEWKNISPDIKPRTDKAYGEYESKRDSYKLLAQYAPDSSYDLAYRQETDGWPRK